MKNLLCTYSNVSTVFGWYHRFKPFQLSAILMVVVFIVIQVDEKMRSSLHEILFDILHKNKLLIFQSVYTDGIEKMTLSCFSTKSS